MPVKLPIELPAAARTDHRSDTGSTIAQKIAAEAKARSTTINALAVRCGQDSKGAYHHLQDRLDRPYRGIQQYEEWADAVGCYLALLPTDPDERQEFLEDELGRLERDEHAEADRIDEGVTQYHPAP